MLIVQMGGLNGERKEIERLGDYYSNLNVQKF